MNLNKIKNFSLVFYGLTIFLFGALFCDRLDTTIDLFITKTPDTALYLYEGIIWGIIPSTIILGFLIYLFALIMKIRFKDLTLKDYFKKYSIFLIVYSSCKFVVDIFNIFSAPGYDFFDLIFCLIILILSIIALCKSKKADLKANTVSNLLLASFILCMIYPLFTSVVDLLWIVEHHNMELIFTFINDFAIIIAFIIGAIISKKMYHHYYLVNNGESLNEEKEQLDEQYPLTASEKLHKRNLLLFITFFGSIGIHGFAGKGTNSKGAIRLCLLLAAGYYALQGFFTDNIVLYVVAGIVTVWESVLLLIDFYDIICDRFESAK